MPPMYVVYTGCPSITEPLRICAGFWFFTCTICATNLWSGGAHAACAPGGGIPSAESKRDKSVNVWIWINYCTWSRELTRQQHDPITIPARGLCSFWQLDIAIGEASAGNPHAIDLEPGELGEPRGRDVCDVRVRLRSRRQGESRPLWVRQTDCTAYGHGLAVVILVVGSKCNEWKRRVSISIDLDQLLHLEPCIDLDQLLTWIVSPLLSAVICTAEEM
jgi:hypothetical protein